MTEERPGSADDRPPPDPTAEEQATEEQTDPREAASGEEEPEREWWPKDDEKFVKSASPRGVIHSTADGKIEDTGPLNKKRMETIDDETTQAAINFIDKQVKADKPFFVWMNTTRTFSRRHS